MENLILEIIQEYVWDKDIQLDDQQQKAVYLAIENALKGLKILGEKEDVQRFKDFILNNSRIFNVRIE